MRVFYQLLWSACVLALASGIATVGSLLTLWYVVPLLEHLGSR